MRRKLLLLGVSCLPFLIASGCQSSSAKPTEIARSESAYEQGANAFKSGNYSLACDEFTKAIDAPGLNPDLLIDALLKRSRCLSELREFDNAEIDVDRAEKAASEMDKVFLARSFLLKKQGDSAGARAEFEKARQIDPQAVQP